ncbi:alanyl-tRNA editing protein [Robertmurraya andreesenii]|uniref:Alanyl-tRNA synthetase n=1 Tax=Anoxybacillus andreesenii TaxID=1325932 RepID=A0ABT9V6S0_9BACL|nr:DHHA1 domain-containing protein [Robertmurraya andreesenii]MDQ0156644.1 alanyl-tRNA synthetase [Robertmurraya andreesenii]
MTEKLYYKNVYQKKFTAKGLCQKQDENGNRYVVLDKTAFYPTGGGQPFDKGSLNGIQVTNVEEIDGEIRHYVTTELKQIDEIEGVVDWERRFDHMQQHSGQHILTAAFVELFGVQTVSFHLGKEISTIDLNTENLTTDMISQVEKRANEIILENRGIETKWVTMEEALQYNLRKELSVSEDIRLVIIPEFDYNGCGGTHPSSTGQVGSIKILAWERQKKQVRLQFVCGNRVLKQLEQKHSIVLKLCQMLSAPEQEMESAVQKLLEVNKTLGKTVDELKEEMLRYEAETLWTSLEEWNGTPVIKKVFKDRTIKELQQLAKIITLQHRGINLFLVAENEDKLQFVCARDADASVNMKEMVQQILPLIHGKGGGSERSAQGGGEAVITGEELLAKIESIIRETMIQ